MARTFNRQPFSVSAPNNNEAKDYFFNHNNWKGMSDDKNFLTSDQETFESCKNVYMDSEGLLRSRPKVCKVKYLYGTSYDDTIKVYNTWTFGEYILHLVKSDDASPYYDLLLVDFNNVVKMQSFNTSYHYNSDKIRTVLIDNKVFIFAEDSFRYVDLITFQYGSATDFVYTPTKKVTSSGSTNEEGSETDNILSDSEIVVYIFDNDFDPNILVGKNVRFTINDVNYEVVFNLITPMTFYDRTSLSLNVSGYDSGALFASYDRGEYESLAMLTRNLLLYSTDGNSWETWPLPDVPYPFRNGILKQLDFTLDGTQIYYRIGTDRKRDYVYMLSVVDSASGKYYPNITLLNHSTIDVLDTSDMIWFSSYDSGYAVSHTSQGDATIRKFSNYTLEYMYDPKIVIDEYYKLKVFKTGNSSDRIILYGYEYASDYDSTYSTVRLFQAVFKESKILTFSDYTHGVNPSDVVVVGSGSSLFMFYKSVANVHKINIYSEHPYEEGNMHVGDSYSVSPDGAYVYGSDRIWHTIDGTVADFLADVSKILVAGKYVYYTIVSDKYSIFSNKIATIAITEVVESADKDALILKFSKDVADGANDIEILSDVYLAVGNTLYIANPRYDDAGNFLWYIPKENKQTFSYEISGLHPISTSEMAVFLPNEVWYSGLTENGYTITKSKLQLGLKKGSDIITSYDGTQVIFPTKRGLAALSYQNFVASTDQALTFLSDSIHSDFIKFAGGPVKLFRYQYWIICYSQDHKNGYVFDVRNNSWWPMSIGANPIKIVDVDNKVNLLLDNSLYKLDSSDSEYKDDHGYIDWYIKSQKLHLNGLNYYKHIANITLLSVLDSNDPMSFKLSVNNYRKKMDTTQVQTFEYDIDAIRTYVQRVSFPKVNEFQYILRSDDEQFKRVPLSLSGISVKYRLGGQVR